MFTSSRLAPYLIVPWSETRYSIGLCRSLLYWHRRRKRRCITWSEWFSCLQLNGPTCSPTITLLVDGHSTVDSSGSDDQYRNRIFGYGVDSVGLSAQCSTWCTIARRFLYDMCSAKRFSWPWAGRQSILRGGNKVLLPSVAIRPARRCGKVSISIFRYQWIESNQMFTWFKLVERLNESYRKPIAQKIRRQSIFLSQAKEELIDERLVRNHFTLCRLRFAQRKKELISSTQTRCFE